MARPTDDSPNSVFVQEMKAAFAKRLLASGVRGKREVDREIEAIMRRCLGRSAWAVAVELGATPNVGATASGQGAPGSAPPRTSGLTRRRASLRGRRVGGDVDGKLAAAGPEKD